jgi:preprotein translocase subunit SecD
MSEDKEPISNKFIDIFKSFRVWILAIFIILSIITINYTTNSEGVVINGITPSSASENAGLYYDASSSLRSLEKVYEINGEPVSSVEDFYTIVDDLEFNKTFTLRTDKETYSVDLQAEGNLSKQQIIGISVRDAVPSNIKLGIELEGGSRLILKPTDNITSEEFDSIVSALQSRLDVYGASGTKVNKIEDTFSGEKFIVVESTSSNKNDIYELIKRQGNFEARISNQTVFTGENVIRIIHDPQFSRFEGCNDGSEGVICSYVFGTEIDSEGSEKFFEETQKLDSYGNYLSEKVQFFLDGKMITELNIASSFKYNKVTTPQITVTGNYMPTKEKAVESAKKERDFLQAILLSQSLPSELEVVQSYSLSSSQGEKLLDNAITVGLVALLLVSAIVALRYKHFGIFVGVVIALVGEVIIVFGVSSLLRLTIDLAAIGGLIAAIGSGVDDNIVITDEYFRESNKNKTSKRRIKNAITIVLIAYSTTVAAMLPLNFAGLKILQGFAFMIVMGVTVGVFITRPAYAQILRIIQTTRKQRKLEEEEDEE